MDDFSEWEDLDNEVELEADPDDLPNIEDEDHAFDMVMNDMVKDMEVNDLEEIEPEYDLLDLNKDGVINEDEIQKANQLINKLQSQLDTGISSWRKGKIQSQINELQSRLNQNDNNTKTY
jgi:predicted O-methyltransferase YrrM